jgi:chromosome segregation ATPase
VILPTGETIIEITVMQMDQANNMKLSLNECRDKNRILSGVLDSCRKAIPIIQEQVKTFRDEIEVKDEALFDRDKVISDAQGIIKLKDKQIRKLKREKTFIGVTGVTIVGIIAGLYIVK